jgi:hypothetical protein
MYLLALEKKCCLNKGISVIITISLDLGKKVPDELELLQCKKIK